MSKAPKRHDPGIASLALGPLYVRWVRVKARYPDALVVVRADATRWLTFEQDCRTLLGRAPAWDAATYRSDAGLVRLLALDNAEVEQLTCVWPWTPPGLCLVEELTAPVQVPLAEVTP